MSAGLLIPTVGCAGEKAGGWMRLCKALESKIRVNSAPLHSLGSSKAAKPSPQHLFLEQGMWSDSLPLGCRGRVGKRTETVQKVEQVLGEMFAL